MIDINVSYGQWPFQPVGYDNLSQLDEHLEAYGIQYAFTSHMGAIWDPDVERYNQALFEASEGINRIVPVPVVNPAWPAPLNWYHKDLNLPGVRICPSYHGYSLNDKSVISLVDWLIEERLVLFVVMRIEDERMQHPRARIEGVLVEEVLQLHANCPELNIICLNAYLPEVRLIAKKTHKIGVDTAFCEWAFTMECLLEALPPESIFMGTHTPFFYTMAGMHKVTRSRIEEDLKTDITMLNAAKLMGFLPLDS